MASPAGLIIRTPYGEASSSRNAEFGLLSVTTLVYLSGVANDLTPIAMYAGPPFTARRRWKSACTAAEVKGVPSWKVTPRRRWKVKTVCAALADQEVARPGTMVAVGPSEYFTRPS